MSQELGTLNGDSARDKSQPTELMSLASSSAQNLKRQAIRQACEDNDVARLVCLTESSGGLLDDSLRRTACKHSLQAIDEVCQD